MKHTGFDALLEQTRDSYKELLKRPLIPVKEAFRIPDNSDSAGIYVFYENEEPLRVGTSTKLRTRIKQHYGSNPRSAAFAKRLARCKTGIKGGTRPGEGWKTQVENPDQKLKSAFEEAQKRIRKMSVKWLEVSDPDVRYLLEFYAAKELDTPCNDFRET